MWEKRPKLARWLQPVTSAIVFIRSQGPDMVWGKNAVFNAKKYNFPLFSGENELAHDNKRVSNYKIKQKSQIWKFRFSGTLTVRR